MSVVMGTAGHIDHGKTTLIKALTGIDCDRLKEEKKRGITIELGFAYLDLPDRTRVSIVDVPGHEKFVKNMVAGAFGIDFVLLTVAADEGIMPQTEEHVEICSLLGVRDGLVAVTKIDKVDSELLEIAIEEIKEFLKDTFLDGSPIIPVSSYTGEGLNLLTQTIMEKVKDLKKRRGSDLFRLPIDRVFTLHGYGTIVTGTLIGGEIKEGEEVVVYPKQMKSRVRSIQVHGQSVNVATFGKRTAINLTDVKPEEIERGDVLGRPDTLFLNTMWDVELVLLKSSPKSLKNRKEIHFHHGTKETLATVYLLDKEVLEPGDRGIARLHFDHPMVGVYGDRFVIRSFSPLRTIGGGRIINPLAKKLKRFSSKISLLRGLVEFDPEVMILNNLNLVGLNGFSFDQLKVVTNLSHNRLKEVLKVLEQKRKINSDGKIFYLEDFFADLEGSLLNYVKEFLKNNPLETGISQGRIFSEWGKLLSQNIVQILLDRCYKKGTLLLDHDKVTIPKREVTLTKEQKIIKQKLEEVFKNFDIVPVTLTQLQQELNMEKEKFIPLIKLMIQGKEIVKITENMWISYNGAEKIKKKVLDFFSHQQELSPQDFKKLTGLSRKYSIPLLEFLDKEKITIRIGNVRVLRGIKKRTSKN